MTGSNSEASPVLRLAITVDQNNIFQDSKPILEQVRPEWCVEGEFTSTSPHGDGYHRQVKMKIFSGGITNKLVGFFRDEDPDDIVIVKMYGEGTEMFIDRVQEIQTMKLLHERKCGPVLYAIFENGIAYEYSPGETLTGTTCRSPEVYPLVAKEMARMHSIPLKKEELEGGSAVWTFLDKFQKLTQQVFQLNPELEKRLETNGLTRDWGQSAIDELKGLCSKTFMPLAFCHNDLLLGNLVFDERRGKVAFIDFEYGAVNYVAFDIANHFNEFAGVDEVDFTNCPDEQFMRTWLAEYFTNYRTNNENQGQDEGEPDLDKWLYWVQLCIPMSHLFWILWAIVQAHYSTIDFDFANYVLLRFPEYTRTLEIVRAQN